MDLRHKTPGRDILGYLLLGISIVMLCKSVMLCFSSDIWYDELFTVGLIKHSYGDLIAFTARDVHPPLYYCVVKFVVELCKLVSAQADPVVVAKAVSVLPYMILFVYSVTLIRRRFGMLVGGLFLFCSIAMPQLSSYTVEVRMYSWALLFVTAAFLHGYGTVSADTAHSERRRTFRMQRLHGIALVFYGLAAAYTQYFACVAVIMVYLFVLIAFFSRDRGRIKEWLLWVVVSVIGYIPWLYVLFQQITAVRENYWILPLTWRSLGGCVKFLMKPAFANELVSNVLAVLLFVMYVAVFVYVVLSTYSSRYGHERIKLYHNGRKKDRLSENKNSVSVDDNVCRFSGNDKSAAEDRRFEKNARRQREQLFGIITAGIGVLMGLVLFGFVASVLLRPIFVYRYMIPAMGCFWLSYALGVGTLFDGELCKLNKVSMTLSQEREKTGLDRDEQRSSHKVFSYVGSKFCVAKVLLIRIAAYAVLLFTLAVGLRNYRAFMGEEEYKIRLMDQTEEALAAIAPEDVVIYNFDQVQAVTSYYLPVETESYLWCGMPETLVQEIVRSYDTVEQTEQIRAWCETGKNVWFLGSFNSRDDIVEEWRGEGLEIDEIGSFLLERYWFNLYKIF